MELLEHYLKAVRIYLPRAKQADILNELRENLRSQMEEQEAELGRPLSETEQEAILTGHGDPMLVASRYGAPQRGLAFGRQLIGPELYQLYIRILWLDWGITAVIFGYLAAVHVPVTFDDFLLPLFIQFVVVTIIFMIIDRLQRSSRQPWSFPPPYLQPVPRWQSASGLVIWGVTSLWWLAVPYFPYLMLGSASANLKLAPTWQTFYTPILLLLLAGAAQRAINLVRPQWNWLMPVTRAITNGIGLAMQYFVILSFPYVVVADRSVDAAHSSAQALAFNGLILWGLLSWFWIYLLANLVFDVWVCAQHLRHWMRREREGAPVRVRG